MKKTNHKGVFFQSSQENEYYYDDNTGFIYPSEEKKNAAPYPDTFKITSLGGRNKPVTKFDGESIRLHHFSGAYGYRHLILEVTAQCNLRCKYCLYSEHYPYNRDYSNANMSMETARAAIDLYMSNFIKMANRNPDAKPIIGFYGGEPLLAFNIIQGAVSHFNQHYGEWISKVLFTVTTNGVVFNEKTQDFLVKNNFSIIVSIDGNKRDHDRNRVTSEGKGSFDMVYGNIKNFQKRYPDYERLAVSIVYDFKTDLNEIKKFFEKEQLFVVNLSQVTSTNSTYHSQFDESDVSKFNESCQKFNDAFCLAAQKNTIERRSFLFTYAGLSFAEFAFHPILHEQRPWFVPYTATCVPGEKLYVVSTGEIHMCERINHNFPIGTVTDGLNYDRIAEIIKKYNSSVCMSCDDCSCTRFCNQCFATCATEDGFRVMDCKKFCETVEKSLVRYVNVAEHRPEILDDITVEYYHDILDLVGYIPE